jgi:hypothetical protein
MARVVQADGDTIVLTEARAPTLTPAKISAYAGTYRSEELDAQLVVAVKDGQLVLRRRPADEMPMRPTYEDDFATPVGSLRFSRDASGRITGFGVFNGRIRDVRFTRK